MVGCCQNGRNAQPMVQNWNQMVSSQSIHAQKDLFRLIEVFPPRLRVLIVLYGSGRVNTWSHLPMDPTALCSSHGKRIKHSMACFALDAVRVESSGLGRNNPFFLPRSSHKSSDPVSLIPTHLETVYVTTWWLRKFHLPREFSHLLLGPSPSRCGCLAGHRVEAIVGFQTPT